MERKTEVSNAELQDLVLQLENRTFVDYFNVFLSLPVFGQHVFYNYMEAEFEFEPPIKQKRHLFLDRCEILRWLYQQRLRLFRQSPLYVEYILCSKLRNVEVTLPGLKESDENGEDRGTFTRNMMGTATGMTMFRESMRGTCGEFVYRCWKDIESWRHLRDPIRKMFWKNAIRTKYISQSSTSEVPGKIKFLVYQGILNFDLIPDACVQQTIIDKLLTDGSVQSMESDDAMIQLQTILLTAMTSYWVPRHLLHVIKTTSEETLKILMKPAPGDVEYLSQERRLRCRFMFPTIYQESNISSPRTTVFTSKSVTDIPEYTRELGSEESESEDELEIEPVDLLSLWGGPAKDIAIDTPSPSTGPYSPSLLEDDSPDEVCRLRSASYSQARHVRSPIPIILTSYLGGKKRTLHGQFPKTTNRIIWSLASDMLACFPFRAFLEKNEQTLDLHYLSFWTDVRYYLDTDESAVDCFGQPLRRLLAHRIVQNYLSHTGESCEIFSETLKMSLFHAISNNNDVALLCMAQDIVQESLWEPLKLYIEDERRLFLKQVRGYRYNLDFKRRRQIDMIAKQSKSHSSLNNEQVDPIYFFNCAVIETDMPSIASPAIFSPSIPCPSATPRPATSYHVSLSEEQMWKAMEIAVLCCEYGTSMMSPQNVPKPEDLVDILHSDYGSLHVSRVPTVRHEWLKSLLHKPKINIETIRVTNKVYLETIDLSLLKVNEVNEVNDDTPPITKNKLVLRRNGMLVDRPAKPKSFIEVLTTNSHYNYFKRFMLVHKMGLPLFFWKAIEDLKDLSNAKTRQIRVTQILRKFFGKYANYGANLDCHEEIIRGIPNMDKVTPGILMCAQAAVYRSMERKWYPMYLDTYPAESESGSLTVIATALEPRSVSPELIEVVSRATKPKKRTYNNTKQLRHWRNLAKTLREFCQAVTSKYETQLLDIFLKCEVEKEHTTGTKEPNQLVEKHIAMSTMTTNIQTRVVVRNRLVIMNRLPQDLRFWMEIKKYQDLVDSASKKGFLTPMDTEFLCDKARSVISCFLHSDVPPKVQVNIPNDMAFTIINGLASTGPTRGLFHDAVIILFPLLYHFWRKFTDEWLNGDIPDDYIETIEGAFRDKVSQSPNKNYITPIYTNVKHEDIKVITQHMTDDTFMKIQFSISDGVSYVYPQLRPQRSITNFAGGRRMTKHSLEALTEEVSPRRESRATIDGDKYGKHDKHDMHDKHDKHNKHDKHDKHDKLGRRSDSKSQGQKSTSRTTPPKEKKKPEKIMVKELEKTLVVPSNLVKGEGPSSMDKARRLSTLVESLNKEREEKIKEQNKRYSKILSFDQLVAAAMKELSDTNSVFS